MSNLWDEDDDLQNEEQHENSGQNLAELNPGQLMTYEANKQSNIMNTTMKFARDLKSCELIVTAAYKVADYVPPFQTDEQSQFWTRTVIPILVSSLKQDVMARSIISRGFGSVGELAIVIQSVYEILRRSRGSKKAIEISQKNIPAALNKLNECIACVEKLDSNAIQNFVENSDKIFKIIGPEAAKFAKQKEALDEKICQKRIKQQDLMSALGKKKGEVESFNRLIHMSLKHVNSTVADLEAAKKRTEELKKLNDKIESTIQNIPATTKQTITEHRSDGWCFWMRHCQTTRTVDVVNTNRKADERYYNNVIKSRLSRLEANQQDENSKQMAIKQLEDDLAGYKVSYEKTTEELESLEKTLPDDLKLIQRDIDIDIAAKENIEKNAIDTFRKIGLQGETLVAALSQVRTFARSMKPGASAYAPFAVILNAIKVLVESHVDLLSSDEKCDIFLAGTLLVEQVKFISDYTASAQKIMETGEDYNQQAITIEMQKSLTL